MAFQRKPVRGRAQVKKLVPASLQRTTTEDTQTAINRIVHEAIQRSKSDQESLVEDVRQRVDLALEARVEECQGLLSHAERLQYIEALATLTLSDAREEKQRLLLQVQRIGEVGLASAALPPLVWRRLLCSYCLTSRDVLTLGAVCIGLRTDHALGLHTWLLPGLITGQPDPEQTVSTASHGPATSLGLARLSFKFRYASNVVASRRGARLTVGDLNLIPFGMISLLDLSFCHKLPEDAMLDCIRRCHNLRELSLRGCSQLCLASFDAIISGSRIISLDLRGCDNIDSDGALRSIAKYAPAIEVLKFGYVCPVNLWKAGSDVPCRRMSSNSCRDLATVAMYLRQLELDLELCDQVSDEGVLAFLECPNLSIFLLWTVVRLKQATLRAVVARFAPFITGVGVLDCYHQYAHYLLVVPAAWGWRNDDDVDRYVDAGVAPNIEGALDGSSLLVGRNISRDWNCHPVFEAAVEHCSPQSLFMEESSPLDDELRIQFEAFAAKTLVEEVCYYPSHNGPDNTEWLRGLLGSSPQLTHLLIDERHRYDSSWKVELRSKDAELLIQQVAENCPLLESFIWLSGNIRCSNFQDCHLSYWSITLQKLRDRCPNLTTVQLLPPVVESVSAYLQIFKGIAQYPQLSLESQCQVQQACLEHHVGDIGELRLYGFELPTEVWNCIALRNKLQSVSFRGVSLTTENVGAAVGSVASLRQLRITNCNNGEAVKQVVRACRCLEEIELEGCEIAEATIVDVARNNVRTLRKVSMQISEPRVVFTVAEFCRGLEKIQAEKCEFTLKQCLRLVMLCPGMRELWTGIEEFRGNATLNAILRQAPMLEVLSSVNVSYHRGLQYHDGYAPEAD